MKSLPIAAAFLLFAPSLAISQPQPKPGVQKLSYYVGNWQGHGETRAGPLGHAGKLSSHMTCTWFAGRFHVVCKGEEFGPTGTRKFLNILGYDEASKSYTEYSISNRGESEYDRNGTLVGNKLTFLVDQRAGGKAARFRYTETHVSPVLMTYRADVAVNGAAWTRLADGEIRKVKP